jgi:hypothetical protein
MMNLTYIKVFFGIAVSILGGGWIFLRIPPPPIFPEPGGKFYIEKEGKKSTNIINSKFSEKSPLFFKS